MGCNESSTERKTHSPEGFQKEMERAYISNLTAQLKALEQKEADILKRSRGQAIIKIRAEIDQIETKITIQRINKTKSCFFEKINKIDKPLARLTRGQRESIQINKIRKESGEITTETGSSRNHQILLQKPVLNKAGRSGENG